jgi:predicted amidohydrolase YtcJ
LSAFEKLDLSAPHNLDYMEKRRQELRTWSEKYGFTNLDKNSHRHRIEHFEFPIKEQVDRVINNGILVSAQPGYAYFDERFQKSYQNYIPEAVFNRQIPLRTIAEQGGVILGSSDSPVQYHDPFIQIAGMVKFPIQNERLSMFQALRTYTLNPAVATFEEDMKGTLEPEKLANFMVLNKDPFTIKDDEIEMLHAKKVYTCGKVVKPMSESVVSFIFNILFGKRKKI